MKTLYISTIYRSLLFAVLAISITACNKEATKLPFVNPQPITLTNCQASPDPATVIDGQNIVWQSDGNYQVDFSPTMTPSGPEVPTPKPSFPVTIGTSAPQTIHGSSKCSAAGCYYKYSLTILKDGKPAASPCIDPGIRIVPHSMSTDR